MNYWYLSLAVLLGITGCGKSDSKPADPKPTPTFTGTVKLADEFGHDQATRSGVLITVTDVSPQVTAETGADGTFALVGVPAGNHTISYTKAGYGTYWWPYVPTSSAGGSVLPEVTLGQVATSIVSLSVIKSGSMYLVNGSVSPLPTAAQPRVHRLYLQDGDNPAPSPIASSYALTLAKPVRLDGTFVDTLTRSQLVAVHLASTNGINVRVRAAGDNPAATTYRDGTMGQLVYPAANLSANTRSVIFYSN